MSIVLYPNNGHVYYNRAAVKGVIGSYNASCIDFRKAAELGYSEAYKAIEKFCQWFSHK